MVSSAENSAGNSAGKDGSFPLKNAVVIGVIFIALYILYSMVELESLRSYAQILTQHAAFVLRELFGEEIQIISGRYDGLRALNSLLTSEGYRILVPISSEQLLLLALMVACLIGWRASIIQKIVGLVVAVPLFYAIDVLRVSATVLVEIYMPLNFDFYSLIVFPVSFALLAFAYIIIWHRITR